MTTLMPEDAGTPLQNQFAKQMYEKEWYLLNKQQKEAVDWRISLENQLKYD